MKPIDTKIKDLMKLNPSRWLMNVFVDWFLIGLVFYQARYFNNLISYGFAIFILGSLQHAIGILGHDGAHRRISKNKFINDQLTTYLCLAPLMMPFKLYQDFHFSHHRFTGTENDGEMEYKKSLAPHWDLPIKRFYIYKNLILDYLGFGIPIVFKMAKSTDEATLKDKIPMFLFWIPVASLCYFTSNLWILLIWFTAMGTSFWAAFRFRLWAEHMGTSITHRYQSTFIQRLLWLPHNIDIHWEHHKYPSVPFWNLKKLRNLLLEEKPIIPLKTIFKELESKPPIPSGTILEKEIDEPIILDDAA